MRVHTHDSSRGFFAARTSLTVFICCCPGAPPSGASGVVPGASGTNDLARRIAAIKDLVEAGAMTEEEAGAAIRRLKGKHVEEDTAPPAQETPVVASPVPLAISSSQVRSLRAFFWHSIFLLVCVMFAARA